MLVDVVPQFGIDLLEAIHDGVALALGEVQRLACLVREERILLDLLPQHGTPNEIGVEEQPVSIGTSVFEHIDRSRLTGRKADDGTLAVIVGLTTVGNIAAFRLFQEQRIYAVVDSEVLGPLGSLRQVYHRHHRVQCLQSVNLVVLVYTIQFYPLFHIAKFNRYGKYTIIIRHFRASAVVSMIRVQLSVIGIQDFVREAPNHLYIINIELREKQSRERKSAVRVETSVNRIQEVPYPSTNFVTEKKSKT